MRIGTTRVETFSDGIIAIIITIMVLQIQLPNDLQNAGNYKILEEMIKLLPNFIAYMLSFITIGIYWINHHHMFHLVEKADEWLLLQNLFSLFWVSLIPVSTDIIGSNPYAITSSVYYGIVMFLTTLSFGMMRIYTNKNELFHKGNEHGANEIIQGTFRKAKRKSIIGTLLYLLSIPLAFIHVYLSFICFVIPPILFFIPEGIQDEELAEKIAQKN